VSKKLRTAKNTNLKQESVHGEFTQSLPSLKFPWTLTTPNSYFYLSGLVKKCAIAFIYV